MAYYGVTFTSKNSLSHFGIKGQKWGVRRFQNADGSYTQEGKQRYGRETTGGLFNRRKKVQLEALQKESRLAIASSKEMISDLNNKEKRFVGDLRDVNKDYAKFFKSMKLSSEDKEKIWEKLHSDFGNGVDDSEYLSETAAEYIANDTELWNSKAPKELNDKRRVIDEEAKQIKSLIEKVAQPVMNKYKDAQMEYKNAKIDVDTKLVIRDMISDNILNNKWLSMHIFGDAPYSSDPGFYESKEYWDAVLRFADDFTAEEYNRRYGK